MTPLAQSGTIDVDSWDTLQSTPMDTGLCVRETDGEFRHNNNTETVLRFVGVLFILSAFVQWSFPDANFVGDPMLSKTLLSVAFALIGMAAYRFAIKGHRAEIRFDSKSKSIEIAALNRRDRTKGKRSLKLNEIKSIYVRRADMPQGKAALRIRLKSCSKEITAIRGSLAEIEAAHAVLCSNIRHGNRA
ncbi:MULTISPECIES: hypothetical protein [unclassified Shimia]|uniref:hypothetical protein n=1 Tax=unclassified Shimia TaxID=2630038 RepID=UPI00310A1EE6